MKGQAPVQPNRTYDVALSFAGEQRDYVECVVRTLHNYGLSVFYDRDEVVMLWGKHLSEKLPEIYAHESDFVVFFVSKEWVNKDWPRLERRAALSRATQQQNEYILPVRFDDTPVPGLLEDVDFVRAQEYSPAQIGAIVAGKLNVKPYGGKASDVPPPRMSSLAGEAVFDYSNHNGRYTSGRGTLEFETKWSKASNTSIHVYNDPTSINGIALGPLEWTSISQVVNAESLDYTSRSRTPRAKQIVVLRNMHGFYAAIHLLGIKDTKRGDDSDELRFQYIIQPDGSGKFTTFDC